MARVEELRAEHRAVWMQRFEAHVDKAVKRLVSLIDYGTKYDSVRLSAAKYLIDHVKAQPDKEQPFDGNKLIKTIAQEYQEQINGEISESEN